MKVSYNIAGTGYTTLFDETDGDGTALEAFDPTANLKPQKTALSGSRNPFLTPRSGDGWSFTLTYLKFYDTLDDAAKAEIDADVAEIRANAVNIEKEQGATVVFYPNAVCDSYHAMPRGLAVAHTFNFTSHEPTTDDPAAI